MGHFAPLDYYFELFRVTIGAKKGHLGQTGPTTSQKLGTPLGLCASGVDGWVYVGAETSRPILVSVLG